jgi:hypothetical protein
MTLEEEPVSKVTFNEISDFRFTAAFQAYSESFDELGDDKDKLKLNELISQLANNEISFPKFYGGINQYRERGGGYEFHRMRIKGQRKRAYRRDQQEKDRIKRHKR